jgi:hypothetical protein
MSALTKGGFEAKGNTRQLEMRRAPPNTLETKGSTKAKHH